MTYPATAQVVVGTRTLMIALAAGLEQSTQSGRLPEVPGSERGELALSLARSGTLVFSDLEGAHLHPERFWRTSKNTVARCRRTVMGIPDGAYTHGSGGSGPGTAALVLIGTALAVKAARQSCPRPPNCSTRSSS